MRGREWKIQKKRIAPKKVAIFGEENGDLRLNHMSHNYAQHVTPHHRKIKKQPLISHHNEKYGHTKSYCFK